MSFAILLEIIALICCLFILLKVFFQIPSFKTILLCSAL